MQIQTGTVTVTAGSANVIASNGNDWSLVQANDWLTVTGIDAAIYTVANVVNPAVSPSGFWEVNLTAPFGGATTVGAGYGIHKDFDPVWGFPIIARGDVETHLLFNRTIQIISQGFPAPVPSVTITPVALQDMSALKAIDSPTYLIGSYFKVWDTTAQTMSDWMLVSGTHASDPTNGYEIPDDYDAVTNQRYFVLIP